MDPLRLDQAEERWMAAIELHRRHPVEYRQGTSPLSEDEARQLHAQVDPAWQRDGIRRLRRELTFGNFRDAFGLAQAAGPGLPRGA